MPLSRLGLIQIDLDEGRAMNKLLLAVFLTLAGFSTIASAEQSSSFDDYVVHYNALTTDQILPSVARPYGILRSKNRVLVNIAVQKKVMGTPVQAVEADVSVTATNLSAQLKNVDMRLVTSTGDGQENDEGGGNSKAIYYIGELPISHEELVTFKVSITPAGADITHKFDFRQQFFTR